MLKRKGLIARLAAFCILLASVISVMLFNVDTLTGKINKGIEFQGGLEVVLQISDEDSGIAITATDLDSIASIISKRIDGVGVKNPIVDIENGTDPDTGDTVSRIRVTLAGVTQQSEQQKMIDTLTAKGQVSFRDVSDTHLDKDTKLIDGASLSYQDGEPIVLLKVKDKDAMGRITRNIAAKGEGENLMVIWIDYDDIKSDYNSSNMYNEWKSISSSCAYIHKLTAQQLKLCNSVISAATVKQELNTDSITITGGFSANEARELAAFINAGSISYDIELVETSYVEGAYGAAAFDKAVTSAIIALIAVAIFMIVVYGIGGLIAAIALAVFAFATIASFNWLGGEYAPDTIAALVIGLGMAIDATIIMLERLKDEVRKGRTLYRSVDESSKKSLSSIVDANITTFIAAFVLFQFGSRTVKGFSIMLTISIVWTVVLMVFLARVLITQIIKTGMFENKKHLFGIRKDTIGYTDKLAVVHTGQKKSIWANINFIRNAKKFIIGSVVIISIGLGVGLIAGPNQSIQFTGGARFDIVTDIKLERGEDVSSKQEEVDLEIEKIKKYIITETSIDISETVIGVNIDPDDDRIRRVTFSFKTKNEVSPEKWVLIKETLEDDTNHEYNVYKFTGNVISSNVARDTVTNAFSSLWWASAAIVLYVTIRFKWTYAISAIIALIHDAAIVFALFTIFRVEISLPFVSAILAIIGYSINDTIVSFDRIREGVKSSNKSRLNKEELKEIANDAIRATATRSLFTTITTLLAVVALLAFGPDATFTFNLAMLIGLIAGTYSSIFIASQVWIQLENFRQKRLKDKKEKVIKINGPDEHIFAGIND